MQLKNRIQNVEKSLGINNSEFCRCYGEPLKREVLPLSLDDWKERSARGEETILPLPKNCETCSKTYDRRFIEETFDEFKAKVDSRVQQASDVWNRHHE